MYVSFVLNIPEDGHMSDMRERVAGIRCACCAVRSYTYLNICRFGCHVQLYVMYLLSDNGRKSYSVLTALIAVVIAQRHNMHGATGDQVIGCTVVPRPY
jgi:hypothetical protein